MDPTNATVPGAIPVLRNTESRALTEIQTTPTGPYTRSPLLASAYDLTGNTAVQEKLLIQIDQTMGLGIKPDAGSMAESVAVEASVEKLKTGSAEVNTKVAGQTLNELPINFEGTGGGGIRNWLTFTYVVPGVAGTGAGSAVNGPRGDNNKVYLEGQDSISSVALGWTGTVQAATVETITEFAVQSSNYAAEHGQVPGNLYNFTAKGLFILFSRVTRGTPTRAIRCRPTQQTMSSGQLAASAYYSLSITSKRRHSACRVAGGTLSVLRTRRTAVLRRGPANTGPLPMNP
jgi:hypothetical protein